VANSSTDTINFACAECGSTEFSYPNDPPKDDDVIKCAGCQRDIGRYDAVRDACVAAAKTEADKLMLKAFGKKPHWK
jgi:hypothetical protein